MTENERKNGQMNVQIMKSQEKMAKFIPTMILGSVP